MLHIHHLRCSVVITAISLFICIFQTKVLCEDKLRVRFIKPDIYLAEQEDIAINIEVALNGVTQSDDSGRWLVAFYCDGMKFIDSDSIDDVVVVPIRDIVKKDGRHLLTVNVMMDMKVFGTSNRIIEIHTDKKE